MKHSTRSTLPLLLDTHIWVWAWERRENTIPPRVLDILSRGSDENLPLVSAISMWEIAMLAEKGRITLNAEPLAWIEMALRKPGVRLVELTPRIAVGSTRLPGNPHGDPADLILMATARDVSARLVTRDRRILRYAEATHALAVLDASP